MKNIILAIDRVEPGLSKASKKLEKVLNYKLTGIRLVGKDYKYAQGGTYVPDDSGFFKEILVDYDNENELDEILSEFADDVLVVNCRDESSIQSFIKVIPYLKNVSTPSIESLEWSTQKNLMRQKMKEYDTSLVPKFVEIPERLVGKIEKLVAELSYPVVVKPCGLHTSMLVNKCNTLEELEKSVKETYRIIHEIYDKRLGTGTPSILVEEFIEGDMYSIDAYITPDRKVHCLPPVRVITSHEVGLGGFYAYESRVPSDLSDAEIKLANEAAISAVKSVGLFSCTAHIELFHTVSGWKIVELGPRIGGHREQIYRYAYGVDHYYNDLKSRLGDFTVELGYKKPRHTISMNIYAKKEGIVRDVLGIEEVKKLHTNVFIRQLIKEGDFAGSSESGNPYHVDAIFSGHDKNHVLDDARQAHNLIQVVVG